jgi:hypothetical protein
MTLRVIVHRYESPQIRRSGEFLPDVMILDSRRARCSWGRFGRTEDDIESRLVRYNPDIAIARGREMGMEAKSAVDGRGTAPERQEMTSASRMDVRG